MRHYVRITAGTARDWLARLVHDSNRTIGTQVGSSRLADGVEWLAGGRAGHAEAAGLTPAIVTAARDRAGLTAALVRAARADIARGPRAPQVAEGIARGPRAPRLCIALGVGPAAGSVLAAFGAPDLLVPCDRIRVDLSDGGVPEVESASPQDLPQDFTAPGGSQTRPQAPMSRDREVVSDRLLLTPSPRLRGEGWGEGLIPSRIWSRTIGALGEPTWQALGELAIVVVGCGRSGSLLATELIRLGVRRLTLIDPDRVEPHNLGEMAAVTRGDVGRSKVAALADSLRRETLRDDAQVTPLDEPVTALGSLLAIKTADLVCCCVDNPAARLATAYLAAAYLRPLVDLGTGVFHEPFGDRPSSLPLSPQAGRWDVDSASPQAGRGNGESVSRHAGRGNDTRRMGLDVRLVLPDRCLACFGGIAGLNRGIDVLRHEINMGDAPASGLPRTPPALHDPHAWRRERSGSLRSLNGLAVHLAVRLIEDAVATRRDESTWLHLEFDGAGLPTLEHGESRRALTCPLCAGAGFGDLAPPAFSTWLAAQSDGSPLVVAA